MLRSRVSPPPLLSRIIRARSRHIYRSFQQTERDSGSHGARCQQLGRMEGVMKGRIMRENRPFKARELVLV